MLLALDAGNSNITIGAFEGRDLVCQWRLRTVHEQTADEWGILLRNLFSPAGLDIAKVDGIIISSVVPPIDSTLAFMTKRYFHTEAMFVGPRTDIGLTIRYDNPNEVGADRLVNGVAGFYKYGGPCVVVDMGTTINFDVISQRRRIPRRRHRRRHRHLHRRAVQQDGAPAAGRFPPAQRRDRHQHRGQHAERASTTAPSA